jgi:hypothetical protein
VILTAKGVDLSRYFKLSIPLMADDAQRYGEVLEVVVDDAVVERLGLQVKHCPKSCCASPRQSLLPLALLREQAA